MSKSLKIGAVGVLLLLIGLGIAFPLQMGKYEPIAVWLEGIALVAIFIWDRIEGSQQQEETVKQLKLAEEQIKLLTRQQERREKVHPYFELVCDNAALIVRVVNLGISNFLVSRVNVKAQDIKDFSYQTQAVVESGKAAYITLKREVCAGRTLTVDLEIDLEYVGLDGNGETDPRCYNVSMAKDTLPHAVKPGLGGMWNVECPRCRDRFGGVVFMSLSGLTSFSDAFGRRDQIKSDFFNSCPNHQSELIMKNEPQFKA
jgi:hypothetical protein